MPAGKLIHAILDNYAAHKHPKVRAWLTRHPRWTFHFTPTSCSWLNAVETFFATLTRRRLQRGAFHSLVDLQAAINRYLDEHNQRPKPFVWTADPDRIIEKVNRGHQTLASNHQGTGGADAAEIRCNTELAAARYCQRVQELIYLYCENDFNEDEYAGGGDELALAARASRRSNQHRLCSLYIFNVVPEVTRVPGRAWRALKHHADEKARLYGSECRVRLVNWLHLAWRKPTPRATCPSEPWPCMSMWCIILAGDREAGGCLGRRASIAAMPQPRAHRPANCAAASMRSVDPCTRIAAGTPSRRPTGLAAMPAPPCRSQDDKWKWTGSTADPVAATAGAAPMPKSAAAIIVAAAIRGVT